MKRGTNLKLKFTALKKILGMDEWQIRGLLDSLWAFATENAPRGDVGRFSDDQIFDGMDFHGDRKKTMRALIECGWVDKCKKNRLLVHDWADHCESWIKSKVIRDLGGFLKSDSAVNKRVDASQKTRVRECIGATKTHHGPPEPEPEPEPELIPPNPPASGGDEKSDREPRREYRDGKWRRKRPQTKPTETPKPCDSCAVDPAVEPTHRHGKLWLCHYCKDAEEFGALPQPCCQCHCPVTRDNFGARIRNGADRGKIKCDSCAEGRSDARAP